MSPSALAAHERREFATELKFPLDPATAELIRAWARERLVPDPNARGQLGDTYEVVSLYFDTAGLDVFHRRGRHHHSKFRIRRYGGGPIFFERKLKHRGRLAKRRTPVTAADLERLAAAQAADAAWPAGWFQKKLTGRHLRPLCQIAYDRTARVLMTDAGPIRLTLDEAIRAVPAAGLRFDDTATAIPVTDRVVLELKYRRELPALFRELVERFKLSPASFSKYRTAISALGLVPATASAAVSPAPLLSCQSS
jgi:hypothetical protein